MRDARNCNALPLSYCTNRDGVSAAQGNRYDTRFGNSDRDCRFCLINPQMSLSCRSRSASVWVALSFAIGGMCNRIIIRLVAFGGLAAFSHSVSAADLTGQVTLAQAFVEVLSAQERVRLAQENLDLASGLIPDIRKRIEAGKASAIEQTRSEVAVASARIELDQAKRSLITARQHLAAQWGSAQPK